MERLTGKDELGYYTPLDVTLNCLKHRGECVDHLGAYEDTGLTPEEINRVLDEYGRGQTLRTSNVPAVEVVRCRDCKHAKELGEVEKKVYLDECLICVNGEATVDGYNIVMPEHFCSYGERKGGEGWLVSRKH